MISNTQHNLSSVAKIDVTFVALAFNAMVVVCCCIAVEVSSSLEQLRYSTVAAVRLLFPFTRLTQATPPHFDTWEAPDSNGIHHITTEYTSYTCLVLALGHIHCFWI